MEPKKKVKKKVASNDIKSNSWLKWVIGIVAILVIAGIVYYLI